MTQDEKVALLRQAGVWDVIGFPGCIDKLIDIVVAHEREACAKVCDELKAMYQEAGWDNRESGASQCAAAIRTRGQK